MVPPGAQSDLGDTNPGHERTESNDSQATLLNDGADSRPKYDRRSLARTTSDDEDGSVFAINNQRFPVTTGTPAGPTEATTTASAGQPTAAAPRNIPLYTTAAQAVVDQATGADTGPNEGPLDDDVDSASQSDDGGSCTDSFATREDKAEDCDCDLCRRAATAAGDVAAEREQAQSGHAAPQHDSYDCCCCLGCCDCDNEPAEEDKTPIDAAPQPESCDCCCCRGCWCCVEHLRSSDEEVEDVAPSLDPRQYKWTVIGSVREGTDRYADFIDESGIAWRRELIGAPCTDVEEEESDDDAAPSDDEGPEDTGLGESSSDDEPLPPMPTVDQDAEDRALELQFEKIRARMKNVREDNQGSIWNNGHRAEVVEGSLADVEDNLDEEDLYTDAGEDFDDGDDDSDDDSNDDDGDDSCDDDDDDDDDNDEDDDDDDYDTDDVDECYLVVVTNSGGSHMTP